MKKFILLTSSILGIATCSAMPYTVQGIVYSSDNNPQTGCSVVLFSNGNDSVPVTGTCCNEQGAFSLQAEQGEYRLRASFIGMSPVSRTLLLDRDLTCDTIWMEPDAVLKEEVTVTAQFIEHRADRFIVKIAGNPLAKNANGMELLYRIPGTWGLSVYGRGITKVFVNDRELRLPAEQISLYLRTIDANDIESYEIIPMAGSEYAGTDSGAILKIKLMKAPKHGANITLSLQVEDKAQQKPSTMAAVYAAASFDKLQSYTMINYHNTPNDFNKSRSTYTYNPGEQIIKESFSNHWFNSITADQSFAYDINPKNEITANFNMLLNPKDKNTYQSLLLLNETDIINPDSIIGNGLESFHNYEAAVTYRHKWDSIGSFLKASVEYSYRNALSNGSNNYYYQNSTAPITFTTRTLREGHAVNPFIDLHIATRHNLSINTGISYIYATQSNDFKQTASYATDFFNPNHYNENIYALYGNIAGQWKILHYMAGLRIEHRDGFYHYGLDNRLATHHETVLLPSASLNIMENADKGIHSTISYSTSIRRPLPFQLDPVTQQTGVYSYTVGNGNLKSAYSHILFFRQSLPFGFSIIANADWRDNVINHITRIGDDRITSYQRFENDGNAASYRLGLYWSKWPTSYWYFQLQILGAYGMENSNEYGKFDYLSANANLYTQFNLPHDWYIDFTATYASPQTMLNLRINTTYDLSASVTKAFFNQRLILKLSAYDFIAPHFELDYKYDKYTQNRYSMLHARFFRLSINYRFNVGRKDIKASRIYNENKAADRINTGL